MIPFEAMSDARSRSRGILFVFRGSATQQPALDRTGERSGSRERRTSIHRSSRAARQHGATRPVARPLRALRGEALVLRLLAVRIAQHLEQLAEHRCIALLGLVDG